MKNALGTRNKDLGHKNQRSKPDTLERRCKQAGRGEKTKKVRKRPIKKRTLLKKLRSRQRPVELGPSSGEIAYSLAVSFACRKGVRMKEEERVYIPRVK